MFGSLLELDRIYFQGMYRFINFSYPLIIPNDAELQGGGVKIQNVSMEVLFRNEEDEKENPLYMHDILNKTWIISYYINQKTINYDPITTKEVYVFLKNMYSKLSSFEKEKGKFLVLDVVGDCYFHPETLYEMLKEREKEMVLTLIEDAFIFNSFSKFNNKNASKFEEKKDYTSNYYSTKSNSSNEDKKKLKKKRYGSKLVGLR